MGFDDFVDVALIHKGVPDSFRINHGDGPTGATVQAARFIDPDFARPRQPRSLDLRFAAIKSLLCTVIGAAFLCTLALVQAEKNMAFVVGIGLRSVALRLRGREFGQSG